jgi:hypothetical protein
MAANAVASTSDGDGVVEEAAGVRVGPGAVEDGYLADVLAEQVQRHEPEPVDGRADRDQGSAHGQSILYSAAPDRADDPDGDPDEQPHDHAAQRETGGRRNPVEDLRLDRHIVLVAIAEVRRLEALMGVERDELRQVDPVLLEEGLVKPEGVLDRRPQLGGRVATRSQRHGIGRGELGEDQERQEADDQQQDDHPQQASDDVGEHWVGR